MQAQGQQPFLTNSSAMAMAGTPTPYADDAFNDINVMSNFNPSLIGDSSLLISQECWDFLNMSPVHGVGMTNGETIDEINEPNLGNGILNHTPSIDHTSQHLAVFEDPYPQPLSIPDSQDLYSVVWGSTTASMMGSSHSQSVPSNFNNGTDQSEMNKNNINSRPTNLGISSHEAAVIIHPNSPIPGPGGSSSSTSTSTSVDHIQNPTNHWGMCNELNVANSQGGSSSEIHIIQPEMNAGLPPVWPSRSDHFPIDCTMLKEITHRKGSLTMNLELHGNFTLGLYSHAIHHVRDQITGLTSSQRVEFDCNSEVVKRFLSGYYIQRKNEGCVLIEDPRSLFFEILSMNGHHDNKERSTTSSANINPDEAVASDSNTKEKQSLISQPEEKAPINLSAQRQRVKSITMDEISQFFHLPRKEAAKKLGLSETVVTKIMHRNGPKRRWPYRKVKALQKGISNLKSRLSLEDNGRESFCAMNEIQRKEEEMAELYRKEE